MSPTNHIHIPATRDNIENIFFSFFVSCKIVYYLKKPLVLWVAKNALEMFFDGGPDIVPFWVVSEELFILLIHKII